MTETIEKPSEEERSCASCLVSKIGRERIAEANNVMAGVQMDCVKCSRNPFGQMLQGLFGESTDNWKSIPEEPLNTPAPKSKGTKKGK